MPQKRLTLFQLVSNDVELLAAIKPGRDRAAETRLYFNPSAETKHWRTRSLRDRRPVFSEIFSEIEPEVSRAVPLAFTRPTPQMTANGVDVVDEGSALEEFDHRKMILESGTRSDAGPARAPHAMKNTKRLPSKCGKRRPGHQPIGVRFISVQDQIDTDSPMGRAMFTIIGAMAELESSLISERVSPPA